MQLLFHVVSVCVAVVAAVEGEERREKKGGRRKEGEERREKKGGRRKEGEERREKKGGHSYHMVIHRCWWASCDDRSVLIQVQWYYCTTVPGILYININTHWLHFCSESRSPTGLPLVENNTCMVTQPR